jgi:hypothetical protein
MRRRIAPPGALAGVVGALLLALGAVLLRDLPGTGASALDVYAYFLDHRTSARIGAAACVGGLALLVPFLTSVRIGTAFGHRRPAAMTTLACGTLAVAAGVAAAAIVGGLAVGAENADPDASRTLLDAAGGLLAAAGPHFAVALLGAAADAHNEGAPAWVPILWCLCGLGCLLWIGPLVSDAAILQPGTVLGTFAGIGGLLAWTVSVTILARRPDPRIAAGAAQ